jgi:predicted transcriptional regulator
LFREYRRDQSTSNGENRGELRQAPKIGAGSTFRSDYLRSSDDRSAWTAESTGGVRTPAVSVRRSVHRDYVVCLIGYRGKTLRRHISTRHGLSPGEYRRRWGLRSNHPLTAPVYSEHRSTMARARGLGRRLVTPAAPVGTPKESPAVVSTAGTAKAKSGRRPRPVSKSNVAGKVAAPMPARRRRSRARIASPSI